MQSFVRDLLERRGPSFSFEFFPPRDTEGTRRLWKAIRELEPLRPSFVDVTYGAGGSTRDRTLRLVERIVADTSMTAVAHLTCTGTSAAEVRQVVRDLAAAGVRNIMALRGDPPGGPDGTWEAHRDGFTHAFQLVELIHEVGEEVGEFSVGVAAFPEGHPEATDRAAELAHFVAKVAAGADFAVTQFFFDADDYFRFVDDLRARGCFIPVIPGVMPVTRLGSITRMAQLSGAALPKDLTDRLASVGDDPDKVRRIGVEVATELCRTLLDGGAPGIHFYTLNHSTATREIFANLAG